MYLRNCIIGRLSHGQPVGTWHYPGAAGVLKKGKKKERKEKNAHGSVDILSLADFSYP